MSAAQILTVAQMQAAEQAIFDGGTTVEELMEIAAAGAAEWIRRIAAGRSITVLCGPGNNGGDGYVIARRMREFGNAVTVVAPMPPATDAARKARGKWGAPVLSAGGGTKGDVFVDCLFGSGLTRALSGEHALLLRDLASHHALTVAVDLPSGIESDTGALLNDRLPVCDATLALGAWKFAHWTLPGRAQMGTMRLVPIGVAPTGGAAELVQRPRLSAPAADEHKYTRGLAAVVGGVMPGAGVLAATAAQRAGAGYVKLFAPEPSGALPADLVCESASLPDALSDDRIRALLVGPGLGRDDTARERLQACLRTDKPTVLDADALVLLKPPMLGKGAQVLATPHDGELEALCRSFSVIADGRRARAQALAKVSGMVVLAKGPDSVIAHPDGRLRIAPPAPSWLSVAGTGDVLAGIAVSRMATGCQPFDAACEAVWLHAKAARLSGAAFSAQQLAAAVQGAMAACL